MSVVKGEGNLEAIEFTSMCFEFESKFFGHDKQIWSREIVKTVNPDQLTPQFDGTKGIPKK
jgi:hypothetical protein